MSSLTLVPQVSAVALKHCQCIVRYKADLEEFVVACSAYNTPHLFEQLNRILHDPFELISLEWMS